MGRFTPMLQRTDEELEEGIQRAVTECHKLGGDFYTILTGIDSFLEKRKRKDKANAYGENSQGDPVDPRSPAWGGPSGIETQ